MATTSSFGKYVLLRKLASGGMGEVFLARQHAPGEREGHLVIKRILQHHLDKADYVEMFFGEAKLVERLSHPNIVQIFEMGDISGEHYIAMEYVRGKSLRDLIDELRAEGRKLSVPHIVDLGMALCDGLGYAHEARDPQGQPMNIVHRDVNPHNVLLSYDGELKIIDFGIAKSEMASVHTSTGTIKGKFVYMSPEQSAADPVDRRSDIFSLGIVLYELTCLENPFVRQNVVLSLEAIQRQRMPPPSSKRADAGPLDDIIQRALAKAPEDRFQSAFELRDALQNVLDEGLLRPADRDLPTFLRAVFAKDIERDERSLTEAEAAAARLYPPPESTSELMPAPAEVDAASFGDDEPTIAGDFQDLAALSRQVSLRERAEALESDGGPAANLKPQISLPAPSAWVTAGDPPAPEAPLAEPLPLLEQSATQDAVDSAALVAPDLRPPRPSSWSVAGRVVAFAAVLLVMTAVGFAGTRAWLNARNGGVEVTPLQQNGPTAQASSPAPRPTHIARKPLSPPPTKPREARPAPKKAPAKGETKPPKKPSASVGRPALAQDAPRAVPATVDARPSAPVARVATRVVRPAPPPPKAVLGRITVRTNRAAKVAYNRKAKQTSPAHVSIRERKGTLRITATGIEYTLELSYQLTKAGLRIRAAANPWAIVKHDGLSLGRTPQGPVPASDRHQLTFLRPGQEGPFVVSLIWKPHS